MRPARVQREKPSVVRRRTPRRPRSRRRARRARVPGRRAARRLSRPRGLNMGWTTRCVRRGRARALPVTDAAPVFCTEATTAAGFAPERRHRGIRRRRARHRGSRSAGFAGTATGSPSSQPARCMSVDHDQPRGAPLASSVAPAPAAARSGWRRSPARRPPGRRGPPAPPPGATSTSARSSNATTRDRARPAWLRRWLRVPASARARTAPAPPC